MRAGVIEPARRRRDEQLWRRWERAAPMELWQLDVVGGFLHADGSTVKVLTCVDDHSRFWVCAALMPCERTQAVCDGLSAALARHEFYESGVGTGQRIAVRQHPCQPVVSWICDVECRGAVLELLHVGPPRTVRVLGGLAVSNIHWFGGVQLSRAA